MVLGPGLSLALLLPATYSIVVADTTSGTLGAAGASCVRSNVIRIFGFARGRGVVHAQAYMNPAGQDYAVRRLAEGVAPEAILAAMTNQRFDADFERRQYGIADREGRSAAFTGSETDPHASHQSGFDGRYTWAVQGNLLTGAPVIERTKNTFLAGACDLPERLLRAMEAGAENGEGDNRCTPNGLPADSAFLAVISPLGDFEDLVLVADEATTVSPLVALRAQLETWRISHPCPTVTEDAGPADADSGPSPDLSSGDRAAEETPAESCQNVPRVDLLGFVLLILLVSPTLRDRGEQGVA